MTSTDWAKLHPIRSKRHKLKWRMKNRKPCVRCGKKLPYPSPGRKYCELCSKAVRDIGNSVARKRRLAKIAAYKIKHGCRKCGYNKCAAALDFHHKDPNKKERRVLFPKGKEFKKCEILCSNCHHEEHEKMKGV